MRIGFTGTRHGMTAAQRITVGSFLGPNVTEGHHGDCIGADVHFHELCRQLHVASIVGHPPTDPKLRAFCACDVLLPEAPYLTRNRHIVKAVDLLLATPAETIPQVNGGTWRTIGYAESADLPLVVVYPDGTIRD